MKSNTARVPGARLIVDSRVRFNALEYLQDSGEPGSIASIRSLWSEWISERKFKQVTISIDNVYNSYCSVVRLRMKDRSTADVYNATWILRGNYSQRSLIIEVAVVIDATYAVFCNAREMFPSVFIPRDFTPTCLDHK